MQEQFHEVVAEERERGTTVFLSSHDLDEVQRLCNRVAMIRDGRLIAVEHVGDLMQRRYRDVSVEFAQPVDIVELRALPGVRDLEDEGRRVRFSVEPAALDAVIKVLARHTIVDLELAYPSLEEIFLTYYEQAG
jgi:ABC-2 type transport system ATP-binding protein